MPKQRRSHRSQEETQISPVVARSEMDIDTFVDYLTEKSLARQLACRVLFSEPNPVQRLKEIRVSGIHCRDGPLYEPTLYFLIGTRWLHLQDEKDLKFRFLADKLYLSNTVVNWGMPKIIDRLCGRGTVKKIELGYFPDDEDHNLFSQLLQGLKISEMDVGFLPREVWELPAVMQMTSVECRNLPMPLAYLGNTAYEYCSIVKRDRDTNSEGLVYILGRWGTGEMKIKKWEIHGFFVDEKERSMDFYKSPKNEFDD